MAKYIPCNICGSNKFKFLFKVKDFNFRTTDEEFDIVKCDECGVAYLNPQPEELSRYYREGYDPHEEPKVKIKKTLEKILKLFYNYPAYGEIERTIDKIKAFPRFLKMEFKNEHFFLRIPYKKDKRILDIGCGNCSYLLNLKEYGWDAKTQLYGIDFPNDAIKKVSKTEDLNIKIGNFLTEELSENFFDVITLKHVLEHFSDPTAAMTKVWTALKKDGKVMIDIPNYRSVETVLFKGKCYHLDPPRHLYNFTPKTLKMLLDKTGFLIEKIYLKESSFSFVSSLGNYGYSVPWPIEKYLIRNMLKVFRIFGFAGEILCIAVKK